MAATVPCVVIAGLVIRPDAARLRTEGPTEGARLGNDRATSWLHHLPVQPTRLYYELSLHRALTGLLGSLLPVVLATVGAVVLARRCAQGTAPEWVLPLLAFGAIVVGTLPRLSDHARPAVGGACALSPARRLASSCWRSGQWPG